ncbi:MAG: cell division protein FtsH, partial [Patescibacteria group bacterium]
LGKEISTQKNYSETIAFQIDEEIKKLITGGLTSAKKVLTQKIAVLHKIAKELISKETLEQKDFYALVR